MLRIRTLGLSEIHLGDRVVSPEHTATFLLLLFTALRAPRTVSRVELAELLWCDAPRAARNHRLRSLLHRARQAGAALECTETTVRLAVGQRPAIDFRELVNAPRTLDDIRRLAPGIGAILPGVRVRLGTPLAARLDDERDVIRATVIRWVSAALSMAKAAGDWPLVEELARAGRVVDPFDEEACLHLAEAHRLTASTLHALRRLDHADGAARSVQLAVSSMQEDGGAALLVWGPAGSGKTPLLEYLHQSRPGRRRTILLRADDMYSGGPTDLALALAARLLNEPGAAGCEPECYAVLRAAVVRRRDALARSAQNAWPNDFAEPLAELLAAIAEEAPTMILLDDMPLRDIETQRFWSDLLRRTRAHRIAWLFAVRAADETELETLPCPDILPRIALQRVSGAPAYDSLGIQASDSPPISAAMIAF